MLHAIFREVLQMSMAASILIALLILFRFLLKPFPKIFSYVLWAALLIRLLLPFSFEISYQNAAEQIFELNEVKDEAEIEYIEFSEPEYIEVSKSIYPYIWLVGLGFFALYYLFAYVRLRCRLAAAMPYDQDNDVYFSDYIPVPFVIGAMYPKIYLPSSLAEKEINYILLHEEQHIRRKDHILKPLALLALCLHWFNPLVWIAFFLASRDMEMSCDEAVLRKLSDAERNDYMESLLQLATGKKLFSSLSIAFGEGDTRNRIHNAIKWKRPNVFILMTGFAILAMILCVGFLIPQNKTILHPYIWIKEADFEALKSEELDEEKVRNLSYIIKELRFTDFHKYTSYRAEKEVKLLLDGESVRLLYGEGVTLFAFEESFSTGKLWGVEDSDLAGCIEEMGKQPVKEEEPWKPSQSQVVGIREQILSGVSEEDISYMTELVKVMNLQLESIYFDNGFKNFEDAKSQSWEQIDCEKYRLYVNGLVKRLKNNLMKRDIEELLFYIDQMKQEKNAEALRKFFYKMHDMDYYLFRYGANELWIYINDKSFVTTFFDSLHIYRDLRAE